jgi:endoglucanase
VTILEVLSNASGAPGDEGEVRQLIAGEIASHVGDLHTDVLGNLFALKKGSNKGRNPRVMLAAHMDEVALMIVGHEKGGQLRVRPAGGIDPRLLPAKVFLVGREKRPAVVGMKPIHLLSREARRGNIKLEDIFLDLGVSTAEEAERMAPVGDYAVFATRFERYGRDAVKGKAFDDRIGCAILAEIAKAPCRLPLYFAFTVQEEVGLRGARVAANRVQPDIGIAIEGTAAADFPSKKDLGTRPRMGDGPAVTTMDRSAVCDPGLVGLILKVAEEEMIPVQMKRPMVGGTDAGRMALAGKGARVAVISVPCRYVHSPASVASLSDINNATKLVKALLDRLAGPGWKRTIDSAAGFRAGAV